MGTAILQNFGFWTRYGLSSTSPDLDCLLTALAGTCMHAGTITHLGDSAANTSDLSWVIGIAYAPQTQSLYLNGESFLYRRGPAPDSPFVRVSVLGLINPQPDSVMANACGFDLSICPSPESRDLLITRKATVYSYDVGNNVVSGPTRPGVLVAAAIAADGQGNTYVSSRTGSGIYR